LTGGWKRLHSEELHNLYASPNIIGVIKSSRMRWTENEARMGDIKNAYKILVGKYEWKIPLERPTRRWEDNFRINLRGVGWEGVDWMHLA